MPGANGGQLWSWSWFLANGSGWAGIGVVGWGRFFTAPPAMGTDRAGGLMFLFFEREAERSMRRGRVRMKRVRKREKKKRDRVVDCCALSQGRVIGGCSYRTLQVTVLFPYSAMY